MQNHEMMQYVLCWARFTGKQRHRYTKLMLQKTFSFSPTSSLWHYIVVSYSLTDENMFANFRKFVRNCIFLPSILSTWSMSYLDMQTLCCSCHFFWSLLVVINSNYDNDDEFRDIYSTSQTFGHSFSSKSMRKCPDLSLVLYVYSFS